MSQYPVESQEQLYQAVNYLLSGPGGLGQNFAGFSSYQEAWLTGNFRIPFSQSTAAALFVGNPDIALSLTEMLDDRTVKMTFAAPQPSPPFQLGNGLSVYGISSYYEYILGDFGTQIGVVECTTTYVIVRLRSAQPVTTPVAGGNVYFTSTGNFFNSTDCNARVTVTGGTDRVFISAQLNQITDYEVFSSPADLQVTVAINRYIGAINNDPTNPDYFFQFDTTVSQKVYNYSALTAAGTLNLETIFTTVIDEPDPAYYWYILEVKFRNPVGDLQVTSSKFELRSLSAQVVKQ